MGFFFLSSFTYKDFHLKYSSLERRKSIHCHFLNFNLTLVLQQVFLYLVNQISFWGVLESLFNSYSSSSLALNYLNILNIPFYHIHTGWFSGWVLFIRTRSCPQAVGRPERPSPRKARQRTGGMCDTAPFSLDIQQPA